MSIVPWLASEQRKRQSRECCTTRVFFASAVALTAAAVGISYYQGMPQSTQIVVVSVGTLVATLAIFGRIVQLSVVRDPVEELARTVEWEELSFPAHKLMSPYVSTQKTRTPPNSKAPHNNSIVQAPHSTESVSLTATELGLLRGILRQDLTAASARTAGDFKKMSYEKQVVVRPRGSNKDADHSAQSPEWTMKSLSTKDEPADFNNTIMTRTSISYEIISGFFASGARETKQIRQEGKRDRRSESSGIVTYGGDLLLPTVTWRKVALSYNEMLSKAQSLKGDPRIIYTIRSAEADSDHHDPSLSAAGRKEAYEIATNFGEQVKMGMPVGLVLTSPTHQALETTRLALGAVWGQIPIIALPSLRPQGFVLGDMDALQEEYPEVNFDIAQGISCHSTESMAEYHARILNAFSSFWLFGSGAIAVVADSDTLAIMSKFLGETQPPSRFEGKLIMRWLHD